MAVTAYVASKSAHMPLVPTKCNARCFHLLKLSPVGPINKTNAVEKPNLDFT